MKTMLVTALFDIDRQHRGDGRSIVNYLEWFAKTLELQCDMTVYTEKRFKNFVLDHRKNNGYTTKIVVQKFNEIPFYKNKATIDDIISTAQYKNRMAYAGRLECILGNYNVVIYSKYGWLSRAVDENPQHDYFLWVDAGISRFFEGFDTSLPWPNRKALDNSKFLIQANTEHFENLHDKLSIASHMWDGRSILVATLFGGGRDIIKNMEYLINDYCANVLFKDNCINNEQICMGLIWLDNPDIFDVRKFSGKTWLPLFLELSK